MGRKVYSKFRKPVRDNCNKTNKIEIKDKRLLDCGKRYLVEIYEIE